MRCRTSRDVPTNESASIFIEPISCRMSAIAGPATPFRTFNAARTPNAAAMTAVAVARVASAMIARLIAVTTATQVGSIT
jgi:hypothetical protein